MGIDFNKEVHLAKTLLTDYYNPSYTDVIKRKAIPKQPERLVTAALEHVSQGKALDIGCGLGRNCLHLARNGFAVTALDLSEVAVNYVRSIAAQENLPLSAKKAHVLHERLGSDFDLVIASWVFDEFNKQNAYWLSRRMQDVTAVGGLNAIVSTAYGTLKGDMRAKGGHHFFVEDELVSLYEGWEIIMCGTIPQQLSGKEVLALRLLAKKKVQSV